ncbi:hypothetical protein [Ideonella alba]|uniref:Uncharacterized protein n=1 Tax=Ideonella alba TaxID=2824118 RepID=A0A940Y2H4_9BURK|nr:hypothetical protein [Ideonella alba]MBQ0929139.1 hypothetical protein [Ideonella alba]
MKQFKQVIIHVGTDKTGSTSIQKAFGTMREPLRSRGLAAYLPGDVHPMLGSAFCAEPESYVFNRNVGIADRAKIQARDKQYLVEVEDFIKSAQNCETLVASYEGFMHLPDEALEGMYKWARRYADSVIAVMYVREPHSYAVSAMGQNVRMGKEPCPNGRIPIHNFPEKIGRLVKLFGRDSVMVRSFESDQLTGKDAVIDFLHIVGAADIIDSPDYVTPERTNQRMTSRAMMFGGAFAKALLDAGIKLPSAEYQRKYGGLIADLPGPSIKLTPEQAEVVAQTSRTGLDYLRSEFGIVFKDPPEKYIAPADTASEEILRDIAGVVTGMVLKQCLLENAFGHIEVDNLPAQMKAGAELKLGVTLFNESSVLWQSTNPNPINIGYRYRGADGKLIGGGGRTALPHARLRARDKCKLELKVKAPKAPGDYTMEISVVQEQHAWLDQKGFTKFSAKLSVA